MKNWLQNAAVGTGDVAAETPAVRLQGVKKAYAGNTVVDNVDLSVAPGEVVSLIGPSGAGKSTLLRCINLLEIPDEGYVQVGEHTVNFSDHHRLQAREVQSLRRTVGMVFQSFNLFPHLSVIENISLPQRRALGRTREEADEVALGLLERVGLAAKRDEHPARLSGGQQQRIAIARALAMDPKVMLFDEPTSSLDPELGLEVLSVMRELADAGMTMIVVTHEIEFARSVGDRTIVMADGAIIESGPSKSVIDNPTVARTQRFLRAVRDR